MNDLLKSWGVGLGLGVVAVLGLVYLSKKGKDALGLLNPASDQNLAYRGVNAAKEAVTGDSTPAGVSIWALFNGVEARRSAEVGTNKDPKVQEAIARKKAAAESPAKKQGGKWTPAASEEKAPSILIPETGGTGPSFESQSKGPWSPY